MENARRITAPPSLATADDAARIVYANFLSQPQPYGNLEYPWGTLIFEEDSTCTRTSIAFIPIGRGGGYQILSGKRLISRGRGAKGIPFSIYDSGVGGNGAGSSSGSTTTNSVSRLINNITVSSMPTGDFIYQNTVPLAGQRVFQRSIVELDQQGRNCAPGIARTTIIDGNVYRPREDSESPSSRNEGGRGVDQNIEPRTPALSDTLDDIDMRLSSPSTSHTVNGSAPTNGSGSDNNYDLFQGLLDSSFQNLTPPNSVQQQPQTINFSDRILTENYRNLVGNVNSVPEPVKVNANFKPSSSILQNSSPRLYVSSLELPKSFFYWLDQYTRLDDENRPEFRLPVSTVGDARQAYEWYNPSIPIRFSPDGRSMTISSSIDGEKIVSADQVSRQIFASVTVPMLVT